MGAVFSNRKQTNNPNTVVTLDPRFSGRPQHENLTNMLNKMEVAMKNSNMNDVQSIHKELKQAILRRERELQNHSSQEELAKCAANFEKNHAKYCPTPATKGGVKKISKKNQQSQKENKSKKKKLSK